MKDLLKMAGWFVVGYYLGRNGVEIPLFPTTIPGASEPAGPAANNAPTAQQQQQFNYEEYIELNGPAAWPYSAPMEQYKIG